jgi:hypothetical protein
VAKENPLDKLRIAKEEEYFHRLEEALLREAKRRAKVLEERSEVAAVTHVNDELLLDELHELGFDRDTVNLLHIVPLVEVAWAEGVVTSRERELIHALAKARGVVPGTPAYETLAGWLSVKPSEAFFALALDANARMLAALPTDSRGAATEDLISQCKRVAQASGGFLGLGSHISDSEAEMLKHIVAELKSTK